MIFFSISLLYFSVDKIVVTEYPGSKIFNLLSRKNIRVYIYIRVREKVKGSKVSQGTVPRFDRFVPPVLACVKIARVTEDGSAGG